MELSKGKHVEIQLNQMQPMSRSLSVSNGTSLRILVLTKRQYMGRDLIDDRYGRFREIPLALAALGHQVTGVCLSYRTRQEGKFDDSHDTARVSWRMLNLVRLLPWLKFNYMKTVEAVGEEFIPDVVWACSDTLHIILGRYVARKLDVPLVIDLYDNFESFGASRLPGVTTLLRSACRVASGLTLVSHMLDEYVVENYGVENKPRLVLGNAVRTDMFFSRPRLDARKTLGLPVVAHLIGTAGALTSNRGIEVLFQAFQKLAVNDPTIWLVVAGPRDKSLMRFRHDRIIDLGMIDLDRVALMYSALDVAVICNIDSDFGRYCFPQKFYEIVACGTPLVAADVGEMKHLLSRRPDCRFPPNSVDGLVACILRQFAQPEPIANMFVPDWTTRAKDLENFLLTNHVE